MPSLIVVTTSAEMVIAPINIPQCESGSPGRAAACLDSSAGTQGGQSVYLPGSPHHCCNPQSSAFGMFSWRMIYNVALERGNGLGRHYSWGHLVLR